MSTHQCPKCALRYRHKTELDQHTADEHPSFVHLYPSPAVHEQFVAEVPSPRAGRPVTVATAG